MMLACATCQKRTKRVCATCKKVGYCSHGCQKKDRMRHLSECRKKSINQGHHTIANGGNESDSSSSSSSSSSSDISVEELKQLQDDLIDAVSKGKAQAVEKILRNVPEGQQEELSNTAIKVRSMNTPLLHLAIRKRYVDVVGVLLGYGANPLDQDIVTLEHAYDVMMGIPSSKFDRPTEEILEMLIEKTNTFDGRINDEPFFLDGVIKGDGRVELFLLLWKQKAQEDWENIPALRRRLYRKPATQMYGLLDLNKDHGEGPPIFHLDESQTDLLAEMLGEYGVKVSQKLGAVEGDLEDYEGFTPLQVYVARGDCLNLAVQILQHYAKEERGVNNSDVRIAAMRAIEGMRDRGYLEVMLARGLETSNKDIVLVRRPGATRGEGEAYNLVQTAVEVGNNLAFRQVLMAGGDPTVEFEDGGGGETNSYYDAALYGMDRVLDTLTNPIYNGNVEAMLEATANLMVESTRLPMLGPRYLRRILDDGVDEFLTDLQIADYVTRGLMLLPDAMDYVQETDDLGNLLDAVDVFAVRGWDINTPNSDGVALVHYLAYYHELDVLMRYDDDVKLDYELVLPLKKTAVGNVEGPALMLAILSVDRPERTNIAPMIRELSNVSRESLNFTDADGNTALHLAIMAGVELEGIEELVEARMITSLENNDGQRAIDIADSGIGVFDYVENDYLKRVAALLEREG